MKQFPITIGFDDAKFELKSKVKTTQLIGVVCQGMRLVRVLISPISIDGDDATISLIKLAKQNEKHIQYVLTDTITFGGFNIIDLEEIYTKLKKPIIAVTEREVDLDSVKVALINKFPKTYKKKLQYIINAGELFETTVETAGGRSKIYLHLKGVIFDEAKDLLKRLCIDSKMPEPVRIAHLIGKAF
ncbi:MAG: DUF99 family protein [Candidatus Heimdallarchaeota archaeon]